MQTIGDRILSQRAWNASSGLLLSLLFLSIPAVGNAICSSPPVLKARLELPATALEVAVAGDRLFVANGSSGLQIVDVSNPASPTVLGTWASNSPITTVVVNGSYAFVADNDYCIDVRALNVSNPAAPTLADSTQITCGTHGDSHLTMGSGLLYLSNQTLWIIDATNPASLAELGYQSFSGNTYRLAVSANRAWVAGGGSGIYSVDVTNPNTLPAESTLDTPGDARDIVIPPSSTHAFVADGVAGGLRVVDITNPSSPVIVGGAETPGNALGLDLYGSVAVVADYGSIQVFDVTNPTSPGKIGEATAPGGAAVSVKISADGRYAYVADGSGIDVFDISGCTGAGGSAPTADFTYVPSSPAAGQAVTFTNTSTGNPTSFSWNFGDGGTSTTVNPSHTYAASGTYTVTLTPTNAYGSNSISKVIVVSGGGCTTAPETPTLVYPSSGATSVPTSNVTFSWNIATCATTYDLAVYSGSSCSATPLSTFSRLTSTSYTVASLPSSSTLSWKVTAKNAVGSTPSTCANFSTGGEGRPAPRPGSPLPRTPPGRVGRFSRRVSRW